jgi:hypothetical protein
MPCTDEWIKSVVFIHVEFYAIIKKSKFMLFQVMDGTGEQRKPGQKVKGHMFSSYVEARPIVHINTHMDIYIYIYIYIYSERRVY